jgi:hypothetical protein
MGGLVKCCKSLCIRRGGYDTSESFGSDGFSPGVTATVCHFRIAHVFHRSPLLRRLGSRSATDFSARLNPAIAANTAPRSSGRMRRDAVCSELCPATIEATRSSDSWASAIALRASCRVALSPVSFVAKVGMVMVGNGQFQGSGAVRLVVKSDFVREFTGWTSN